MHSIRQYLRKNCILRSSHSYKKWDSLTDRKTYEHWLPLQEISMPQLNDYWGIQGSSGSIPSAIGSSNAFDVAPSSADSWGKQHWRWNSSRLSPNFWYRSGKVGKTVTELYKVSKSFSGSWSSYNTHILFTWWRGVIWTVWKICLF